MGNQKVLLGFLYNCKVKKALNRMKRDFSQWAVNKSEFSPPIDNSENASIIQLDMDGQFGRFNEYRKRDEDLLELLNIKKESAICLSVRRMKMD